MGAEPLDAPIARSFVSPRWAAAFSLVGLALSITMAVLSDSTHQDDDLTHYQMAHWVWQYPAYLLDNWGRPGFTIPYAPAAGLGWTAARIFSGLLTALTAWLTYLIARRQGVALAACVPLLLWLQPLTFTLSYTTLTETPLALYLALAMWLYLRGNFALSAAAISLTAVTRHEAMLFPALWAVVLIARRRPAREWLWAAWAPVAYNVLGAFLLPTPPWAMFLDAKPTNEYGTGTWLSMYVRWVMAAGLGPLLLACVGAPGAWRLPGGRIWIGTGLLYFGAQTAVFRFGLFASGGYPRFLVPLGPVVAVAAAVALSEAWGTLGLLGHGKPLRDGWRRPLGLAVGVVAALWLGAEGELATLRESIVAYGLEWALVVIRLLLGVLALAALAGLGLSWATRKRARTIAVVLFPAAAGLLAVGQPIVAAALPPPGGHCGPLRLEPRLVAHREAVEWLRTRGLAGRRILAASPWFDEFLGRRRPQGEPPAGRFVERLQPGDILLWDCRLFPAPRHGYAFQDLVARDDFRLLWKSGADAWNGTFCAVFEKIPHPTSVPAEPSKPGAGRRPTAPPR